ncbi:serine/threonine-protein kinase H1-like isoform X2 [Phyllobates terribilis]|uniref:serine/threonine-protein kinase H1-like isoform X2 n=1 Tax=Phyllobates terribilis TaxID=111132 RepID=UPI003CCADA47
MEYIYPRCGHCYLDNSKKEAPIVASTNRLHRPIGHPLQCLNEATVCTMDRHCIQSLRPRLASEEGQQNPTDQGESQRYDIKALIGRGSFSRVVRVEHRATRQPFAIKMIETRAKEGKEVCESELNILRRVSHHNIIQLIEVFETHDRVYMVMELATGGDLLDRIIAKGSFTERDATKVLHMVLDSINYLHGLGITHRDLKPENLLYYHPGADSKIVVTDFGLANAGNKGGDWSMRTICGTPEYIAPEIILKKPYSNAVDMWALGVMTYFLLSGCMPFEDENRTRLYRLILKGRYSYLGDPWPSVSNLAKDFIDRLITVDYRDRSSASDAIQHPWIKTMAASSSMKNLHRSISQNLRNRVSSRCQSTKSEQSMKSGNSNKSRRIKEIMERNMRYHAHIVGSEASQ